MSTQPGSPQSTASHHSDRRHEQAPAAAAQSNSGTNNVLVCMKAKK